MWKSQWSGRLWGTFQNKIIKQNLSESCSGPAGAGGGAGAPVSEPEEPEEQTVFLRLRELCALPVTPVQIIEFTDKLLLTPRRSRRATVVMRNSLIILSLHGIYKQSEPAARLFTHHTKSWPVDIIHSAKSSGLSKTINTRWNLEFSFDWSPPQHWKNSYLCLTLRAELDSSRSS